MEKLLNFWDTTPVTGYVAGKNEAVREFIISYRMAEAGELDQQLRKKDGQPAIEFEEPGEKRKKH